MQFNRLGCILAVLISSLLARADALDQWMTRTSPVPVSLYDIVYAKGLFVAVGVDTNTGSPRVIVSSNGVDWVRFVSFAQFVPRSITYGSNGLFVAVGDANETDAGPNAGVIVSTNGTNWSFFPTFGAFSNRTNFFGVTYGNGLFVAVGDKGTVATSYNGTNWATHATPTTYPLYGIAYGNGVWIAAGPRELDGASPGSPGPRLASTDGTNWVQLDSDFNAVRILYARGMFMAIAGDTFNPNLRPMRYSVDGTNWMNVGEPVIHVMRNITYGAGAFVAVGNGLIKTSLEGTNWVQREPQPAVTDRLRSIAYGMNTFVAVGDVILQSEDIRPRFGIAPDPFGDFSLWAFTLRGISNAQYRIENTTNSTEWQPGYIFRANGREQTIFSPVQYPPFRLYRALHVPD